MLDKTLHDKTLQFLGNKLIEFGLTSFDVVTIMLQEGVADEQQIFS